MTREVVWHHRAVITDTKVEKTLKHGFNVIMESESETTLTSDKEDKNLEDDEKGLTKFELIIIEI